MEWKLLWVVLVAFYLGGWGSYCDGCWDQEKTALLQLKSFFSHIEDVDNWVEGNQSSNCCKWERVECSTFTGRVIRLNFTAVDLRDDDDTFYWSSKWDSYGYLNEDRYLNASLFLPFEELKSLNLSGNSIAGCVENQGFEKLTSKLDKLEVLDISGNYFNDSILTSLSELSSLKSLNFADNQFTGSNPSDGIKILSKLKNLETLDLSGNMFGNNIISRLGSFKSLRSLSLQNCGLQGTVQMLEFNNLTNLKELYLDENEIKSLGSLFEDEKGEVKLMIKLEILGLSENLFNNSILSFLGSLSNLKSLDLGSNTLEGLIQIKELNALSNLEKLYIPYNRVNDFVTSQDNTELRLMNLDVLDLCGNNFNNSILSSLNRLSNLKSLDLFDNNLKGSIDLTELNALIHLENLAISCGDGSYMSTDTNCSLPLELLSSFPSLKTLSLAGFSFQRAIKTSQSNTELRLMNLEILDLSGNFNSSILSSLNRLSNLKSLDLSYNNFNGSIDLTELNALIHLENLAISCVYDFYVSRDSNCSLLLQSLALFPSLKTLSLRRLNFQGIIMTFKNQRHNFTNLEELILEDSFLQTNFLRSITEFTFLKRLKLLGCEINGSLALQESHNFTNLEELNLESSILQANFLQSIGQFTSLKHLFLHDCMINGSLTFPGFCELTNLRELVIRSLSLNDDLPDCFSNLTSLQKLDLSSNQFSGNINALESLTSLQILDLSSNQFSGNINALESLTSLQILYLSSNQFSRDISALRSLASLQALSLSDNYFEIPISLEPLLNLSKLKHISADNNIIYAENQMHSLVSKFQLEKISLSCCGVVKSFPEFLYHQQDLEYLDLSNIYFKGNQFPNWLLENNTKLETLILTNSSLSGPLQLPLASHMHLMSLEISNNLFNGIIPVEIGAQLLSLLYLNMSKNCFNGRIPSSFGAMSSLAILDLSNNQFSGGIPDFWSKSPPFLSTLDVSNNQLSGTIPRWMGNMSFLKEIIMSNNHLEGTIPAEFCQLDLVLLDLSVNDISGSLPFCFNTSRIRQVHLSKNRLRGGLPIAFRNSSTLVTLDISDNFLTGSIPSWIGELLELSYLLLSKNNFEGGIPMELCNLSKLSLINLSHNNLSGRIPPCLNITTLKDVSEDYFDNLIADGHSRPFSFYEPIEFPMKNMYLSFRGTRILPYMSGIDLSCNKLVGEIPYEFGNFSKILVVNLSHNSLTGPIPPTFANLGEIESLDLSYNHLNGIIPPQLVRLTFLSCFNVSFNNLSGKTPARTAQFGTFDESSYRGNLFLCGEPLPKCIDAEPPSPIANSLTDKEEDNGSIDMGVFYVSFIVSYIVMLLATIVVLYINPYWRRAWFYRVEIITTSCYYFVIDNVLSRGFHCGNM